MADIPKKRKGARASNNAIADAARAALEGVLARDPHVVVILSERAGTVQYTAVPNLRSVARGLIGLAAEKIG